MRITALLALLSLGLVCHAQDEEYRVIPSLTDWIEEIQNTPDSIYRANYIEIRIDFEKDAELISYKENQNASDRGGKDRADLLTIDKHLVLNRIRFRSHDNPSFSNGTLLRNLRFSKSLIIYNLENHRFGFDNCVFDELLQIRVIETRFFFVFVECTFNSFVNINNPRAPTPFIFDECISRGTIQISSDSENPSLFFIKSRMKFVVLGETSVFKQISIDSTEFEVGLSLAKMTISNSFFMQGVSLKYLDVTNTQFPNESTYIPFDSLKNKLCLELASAYSSDGDSLRFTPIKGESNEELKNFSWMDQLTGSYTKLLNIYKSRGEMRSYNAAYIEMRDKQTAQSKLIYADNPNFQNYFDWQINRFTRAFSDYGTRPAKAIFIFFQVVLAFSVFYFFFPSTWNATDNRKLMKRLRYLGSYFTSRDGLADLFEKETKDEFKDYEEFHAFISSSEKRLPVYFQWLSKPLYQFSVSRFNFTRGVLRRTEILNGEWAELPAGKKALTSFVIGLYLMFYLVWIFLVRCLNAITLSLNAFSTLGFGEIPTRGLARYVAIVQGFVGWFLLSIFLVSLIGQILN
ncbi:hypothetical protein [Ekhidna sp.]|uniref:hypothetical protein n=1 Tax=Ekhidna sp. TaxID=2608089 RepID=UPI0032EF6C3B